MLSVDIPVMRAMIVAVVVCRRQPSLRPFRRRCWRPRNALPRRWRRPRLKRKTPRYDGMIAGVGSDPFAVMAGHGVVAVVVD